MPSIEPNVNELLAYAYEAGRRGQWAEAHVMWVELDAQRPQPLHRIMALETARLAGILPLIKLTARDTVDDVINVLSPPYSEHLLAEIIRKRDQLVAHELEAIRRAYSELPEVIKRAIAEAEIDGKAVGDFGLSDMRVEAIVSVRNAPHFSAKTLFSGYELELPPLNLAYSEQPIATPAIESQVRDARRLILRGAVFTSGSDAIELESRWYFDSLTYENSRILEVTADPVVLAFNAGSVALSTIDTLPLHAARALWLAYPLTQAWGHFFLECLTRLAIINATTPDFDAPVYVGSDVPDTFLDFARYVYPWTNFRRVDSGERVKIAECTVIPSRVLTLSRFRWSPAGNEHVNMESQSISLIAKDIADALSRNGDSAPMFANHVYLDRSGANYRKSVSETAVRSIAASHGFLVVDPGTLSPAAEANLFHHATDVCGFLGSQILLSAVMREARSQLFIYHDEPTEMRALSTTLSLSTASEPQWILGTRPSYIPGYSEPSIHQEIRLSDDALAAIDDWFEKSASRP